MTTSSAATVSKSLASKACFLAILAGPIASANDRHQMAPGSIRAIPTSGVTLDNPFAVAVDRSGNIYIADTLNNVVREVNAAGEVSTVAGNGKAKYSGDHGPATSASLNHPGGIAVDEVGNLYINDENNFAVRKVNTNHVISTIAGTGKSGYSGDGGPATKAQIAGALGVAVDRAGNVYLADTGNCVIRKVNTKGIISTVVGNGAAAYFGDGGPAMLASLRYPTDVALDAAGNLYIADYFNGRVRKVSTYQFISTVAGNGEQAYSGDNMPATAASLHGPVRVALDSAGNLYVETDGDGRIRQVNSHQIINTIAGNGTYGDSGDGGPATLASLKAPYGMAIDKRDTLYVADTGNSRVRAVTALGFPIKVPLPNSAPGPTLFNDANVGSFSSGNGVADWHFSLSTTAKVTFHFVSEHVAITYLRQAGKPNKAIDNSSILTLSPGNYYVESSVAERATIAPRSDVAAVSN